MTDQRHAADPRAVRVAISPSTALPGDPTLVVAPPAGAPKDDAAIRPIGAPHDPAAPPVGAAYDLADPSDPVGARALVDPDPAVARPMIDGEPVQAVLRRHDAVRADLDVDERGSGTIKRTRVLLGPLRPGRDRGTIVREVVADGWRFEVEVELEGRARLRERARRGEAAGVAGGPVEVRAIIPGRVVAVSVGPGDAVLAGQQILVVEAMKMQNELRAPREGMVERVGVAVGDTIDVGDLLVVIH